MPYIKKADRAKWQGVLDSLVDFIAKEGPLNAGTLSYLVTKVCLATRPQSYTDFNTVIGVLECAKQEFYRRMVAPYETTARDRNGEVYN